MTVEEFSYISRALRPHTDYLYFHILGEPLLHPQLGAFLDLAGQQGFKVILTTNGTLLEKCRDSLLSSSALHKVSISLHAYEANEMSISIDDYLSSCFSFCRDASALGIITVMRLWNVGGNENKNGYILDRMREFFGSSPTPSRNGFRLGEKIFFEWGEKFEWPDEGSRVYSECRTCYGLRDQIGVLCDGSVVPCCLDAEGTIALGNIFENSLEDILSSPRAVALKRSFENRQIKEPLCRHCGFAVTRLK